MVNKQVLYIRQKGNLVIIRFPVTVFQALFPLFFSVFFILPAVRYSSGSASAVDAIITAACLSIILLNYLMLFMRKLIIDKEKETVTYYSYYSRTFAFREIVFLKSEVVSDDESTSYHLAITLHGKTIKVKTQSEKQSEMLRTELVAFTSNGRLAFRH